ncbi:hypothetical protein [Wenyingzhuangia sp. IMCC45467]
MRKIEKLISQIIPKFDSGSREDEWFNNDKLLSELSPHEYEKVEEKLIEMLEKNTSFLVGETLVKIKSTKSLTNLKQRVKEAKYFTEKVKWAMFIFKIKNGDNEMEELIYNEFLKFNFNYEVEGVIFYDLIQFKSNRINKIIESYINHKYFLVAHHAKKVIESLSNTKKT